MIIESGTIKSAKDCGVYVTATLAPNQDPQKANFVMNGGYIEAQEYGIGVGGHSAHATVNDGVVVSRDNAAVAGNGTKTNDVDYGGTTIDINGGVLIGHIVSEGYTACGVYHPQSGQLNIIGGTIYADDGVGVLMRAGNANITGGHIIVTGNNSGQVGDSSTIADSYGVEYDEKSKYPGMTADDKISISGTVDISAVKGAVNVITDNTASDRIAITGGTFSSDVTTYVPTGYECTQQQDGKYAVKESTSQMGANTSASENTANTVVSGNLGTNQSSGNVVVNNGTVNITATTGNDGTQSKAVSNSNVSITNNALNSLNDASNVQNVAITTDVATVTIDKAALNAMTDNANGDGIVLSVEKIDAANNAPLTYSITAVTSTDNKDVYDSNSAAGSVTINVPYYNGTNPQVFYVGANGLENMNATYDNNKNTLTWTTSHFSDYVVLDDSTVATITSSTGVKAFKSLQDAVDAANTGDVVRLEKNVVLDGTNKVDTQGILKIDGKTITLDGNGYSITANNVTVDGNKGPSMINIQGNSNVTVKNLTIDGQTENNTNTKHGLNVYQAAVTVENVIIKNGNGYAIVANGSTATVNGLTTENNKWGGINVDNKSGNASLDVNSATIKEQNSIKFEKGNTAGNEPSGTINGGNFQYVTTGDDVDLNLLVNGGTFATATTGTPAGAVDISKYLASGLTINPSTGEVYEIPPYTGKYSYAINVANMDNGSVSVDKYATEGEKVTLTVSPDKAYKLDELTVTAGGKDVELTDNGDGTYTFTMPSSNVKVSASFVEDKDYVEPDTSITMTIGSNDFVINNNIVTVPDAAPYIANDRAYVPFRALGEALGAKVVWDNDARTVTYTLGDTEIVMTIGDTTYTINGVEKSMDVAPEITGDRTYVPVRFVAEGLGFKVTPLYADNGTTTSVVFEK